MQDSIIIIDDTPDNLHLLVKELEREEYLVRLSPIEIIAAYFKIRRHILSEVISQQLKKNFSHFIAEYRISHILKLILQGKHKEIIISALVYELGFNMN